MRISEHNLLKERPSTAPLPWRLESYGRYNFLFFLDFGSFRDIQRHRNGVCQIPLVEPRFGIHPWYLTQCQKLLSSVNYQQLLQDISNQFDEIDILKEKGIQTDLLNNQYLYPMGTMALVHASYSVPQALYVGELRSGKTVHGSLRPIAQKILKVLATDFPDMALYGDMEEEGIDAKRGEQTISMKAC